MMVKKIIIKNIEIKKKIDNISFISYMHID